MIYLIEYDRREGKLRQVREFSRTQQLEAENLRLQLEVQLLESGASREVVLLEASSEEELRKTHRRYFETLMELTAS